MELGFSSMARKKSETEHQIWFECELYRDEWLRNRHRFRSVDALLETVLPFMRARGFTRIRVLNQNEVPIDEFDYPPTPPTTD